MRPEELYLGDIVEAADAIKRFLSGVQRDAFLQDELLCSGVLQKLSMIGEAAAHLPLEFRNRHPEIEWADIIGFRNIAVHAYFAIEWEIVWVAASQDVPDLQQRVADILAREYPGSGPAETSSQG